MASDEYPDKLTPHETTIVSNAKDNKIVLEILEYTYDYSVRKLRFYIKSLNYISFATAICLLYVLYVVANVNVKLNNIISLIGSGISIIVILLTLINHIYEWSGQIEKKTEISNLLHSLVDKYDIEINKRPINKDNILKCDEERSDIERKRKHDWATIKTKYLIYGYQYVAMKYPDLKLKCNVCGREWKPEFNQRKKWVWLIPFMKCEGCGV